jgi:hypothetical protein
MGITGIWRDSLDLRASEALLSANLAAADIDGNPVGAAIAAPAGSTLIG